MSGDHETYLGDGLYASFDGFQFILRAPRLVGGDHYVALEPAVLEHFLAYVKRTHESELAPQQEGKS